MRKPCSYVRTIEHVKSRNFVHQLISLASAGLKREAQRRCGGKGKSFIPRTDQWVMTGVVSGPVIRTRTPYVYADPVSAHLIRHIKRVGYVPSTPELMQVLVADGLLKPGGHSLAQLRKQLRRYAKEHDIPLVYGPVTAKLRVPDDVKPQRAAFAAKWAAMLDRQPELICSIAAMDEIVKHAYPHPKSESLQLLHVQWNTRILIGSIRCSA